MDSITAAYNRFCIEQFPTANESDVRSIEQRIGTAFPFEYFQYLINFNGGYFSEPDFPYNCNGEEVFDRLTFMNGIHASHSSAELASENDLSLFSENYPVKILPIGYTLMGNLLLLDLENNKLSLSCIGSEIVYVADSIDDFFKTILDTNIIRSVK